MVLLVISLRAASCFVGTSPCSVQRRGAPLSLRPSVSSCKLRSGFPFPVKSARAHLSSLHESEAPSSASNERKKALDSSEKSSEFTAMLSKSIASGSFVKTTLSKNKGGNRELVNVYLRVVELKKLGKAVQFLLRHKTNDITKNYPVAEAGEVVDGFLEEGFQQAHLFTTDGDWELKLGKKPVLKKVRSSPTFKAAPSVGHDREKIVPVDNSASFLQVLGVTSKEGKPRPGMADKLRQIQKFVSIVDHAISEAKLIPEAGAASDLGRPLRVVDMGCGKGYLTFAMHSHLVSRGIPVLTQGVELRKDLVAKTNKWAQDLDLAPLQEGNGGLRFVQGYISEASGRLQEGEPDVLVALHACDTATDDAIFTGIRADAKVIITAPCCHKELRLQFDQRDSRDGAVDHVLSHGILRQRTAEITTDGIRALLLEIAGYRTSVFEFIDNHHTAKNLMITAFKRDRPLPPQPLRDRLTRLMEFYGLREQRLAVLLGEGGVSSTAEGRAGRWLSSNPDNDLLKKN